jgi:hypothetical protein
MKSSENRTFSLRGKRQNIKFITCVMEKENQGIGVSRSGEDLFSGCRGHKTSVFLDGRENVKFY